MICRDEMGPEGAKGFLGSRLVRPDPTGERRARATPEADYGRRGAGYVFGAFVPATGEAMTAAYGGRTTANWVDFLDRVDGWAPAEAGRVYAVLDNLSTHRALDALLWALAHPRWEFVFQPTSAAYLNLIEPWWKILRSLALKGRRFGSRAEVRDAVAQATAYGNAHKHPFAWGKRKRRRPPTRGGGIACLPIAT